MADVARLCQQCCVCEFVYIGCWRVLLHSVALICSECGSHTQL